MADCKLYHKGEVKDIDHPVVLHIVTKKGKGYKFAEDIMNNL